MKHIHSVSEIQFRPVVNVSLRVSVDGAEGLAGRGTLGFSERSRPCPVPLDPPAAVELEVQTQSSA